MSKRVALGKAIKAIREAKNLPGSTVATDCLISHGHLLNIEAGRRPANPEVLAALAERLKVDIDAISYETSESVAV